MKCSNCNTQNENDSKFCIKCGNKLEQKEDDAINFCSECGIKKRISDKFCINCGHEFETADNNVKTIKVKNTQSKKNKHQPHKRYVKGKIFDLLTELKNHKIFTAAVIIIIGYFFFQVLLEEPEYNFTNNPINQSQPNVPLYGGENTKFNQVASKFVCSCGTCDELSLETCSCPTAKKEHDYINSLLSQNSTISQTIIAVANKYGWLKSQFYPQYKVEKSKVWFGAVSQPSSNLGGSSLIGSPNTSVIATIVDRNTIINQFECPCGQCNVKELYQCICNHPNGSVEVKGFIDQKILERNKTVLQIIDEVNNKYGGRKI